MTAPVISVIGGGPGGLTCARILQRHGIEVTVYDRDPDRNARNQGGTLDLHADDGQIALKEAGLLDEFFALARPEGQEMRQLSLTGEVTARQVPEEGDLFKPEIDRGQLRDLLLDSLRPGTVRWGKALESVEGPHSLLFADGTRAEADLIIGADGGFSKVRPFVSDAVPHYSGVSFIEAWFHDVENRHADLSALVGQGSAAAADGSRCLFAQRNSGGHIRVYIVRRAPLDWAARTGGTEAIRASLLDEFSAWGPRMRQMIENNDGPYVDRPLFVLPPGHTWEHSPTVTLLGDAAHLMPPVGVGVNLAMLDASELALSIVACDTVDEAITRYEKTMLPRSIELTRRLDGAAGFLLDADGPPEFGDDE